MYNGRLIVKSNFKTNDNNIFAGGSLCGFSGEWKLISNGKPLFMHFYNGREIGIKMANAILL